MVSGGFGQAVEARFLVGDQRHDRIGEDADRDAGFGQRADCFETEFGTRRAGFELAGERDVERRDGDVDAEPVSFGDFL